MNQAAIFASRHKAAQLPLKYMRRSVSSLFQKDSGSKVNADLTDIEKQFRHFIETPIRLKQD